MVDQSIGIVEVIGSLVLIVLFLVIFNLVYSALARIGLIDKDYKGPGYRIYIKDFRKAAEKFGLTEIDDTEEIRRERVAHIDRLAPALSSLSRIKTVRSRFEGTIEGVPIELLDWIHEKQYRQETVVIMPWMKEQGWLSMKAGTHGETSLTGKPSKNIRYLEMKAEFADLSPHYRMAAGGGELLRQIYTDQIKNDLISLAKAHEPFEILVRKNELIVLKSITDILIAKRKNTTGFGYDKYDDLVEIVNLAIKVHKAFHAQIE